MRSYQDQRFERSLKSLYGFSWATVIPWKRRLFHKQIETRFGDNELNCILREQYLEPETISVAGLGLVDPVLRESLRQGLYLGKTLEPSLHYTQFIQDLSQMILELRLLTLREDGPLLVSYMDGFPPFAAIYLQAIRTVADLKLLLQAEETQTEPALRELRTRLQRWVHELGHALFTNQHLPHVSRLKNTESRRPYINIEFKRNFEERMLDALLLCKLDPGIHASRNALLIGPIQDQLVASIHPGTGVSLYRQGPQLESVNTDLGSLDASYICSGPFRLMLTTLPEKHLFLDPEGFIHIFFDFRKTLGCSLNVYKGHFVWDMDGKATT